MAAYAIGSKTSDEMGIIQIKGTIDMAYGDYDGPKKPGKGEENGCCNRTRCQSSPAMWFNHGSFAWYCADCARDIGMDHVNLRGWRRDFEPRVGHPQFETRAMMDERKSKLEKQTT